LAFNGPYPFVGDLLARWQPSTHALAMSEPIYSEWSCQFCALDVQQIFSSDGSKPNAVDFAEFDGEGKTDVAESYNGDCWGLAFLPKASG
jgi:hypothetical protein